MEKKSRDELAAKETQHLAAQRDTAARLAHSQDEAAALRREAGQLTAALREADRERDRFQRDVAATAAMTAAREEQDRRTADLAAAAALRDMEQQLGDAQRALQHEAAFNERMVAELGKRDEKIRVLQVGVACGGGGTSDYV